MSTSAQLDGPARRRLLPLRPIPHATDLTGLVLRATFGPTLAYHGWLKLDRGAGQFADFVGSLEIFGMGLPRATGYLVVWLELAGGILLTLGLATRLLALCLAAQFLIIPFVVKSDVGLIGTDRTGFEIDLMIAAAALVLLFLGPGRPSADHLLGLEAGPDTTTGEAERPQEQRSRAAAESPDRPATTT